MKAKADIFRSAGVIVDDVITDVPTVDSANCPKPFNLVRMCNRARQSQRPPDPIDLHFDLTESVLPDGFLQADIRDGDCRHIVFCTGDQLSVLDRARTWYMDSTFKVVKRPFTQLLSIHAFVKGDSGEQKQIPLVFGLMSSRTKRSYKKVLKKVKTLMPSGGSQLRVACGQPFVG